jgi:hypothetical protein
MIEPASIVIDRRFRGPADSGNGGYTAGLLAGFVGGTAEVRLMAPPPLDTPIAVIVDDAGAELRVGDGVIARARPAAVEGDPPPAVALEVARRAAMHYLSPEEHLLPGCFTCGPHREEGDGLRIFAGREAGDGPVSSPWTPHARYADDSGVIEAPVIWAALDCPGFFAHQTGDLTLLGSMTAELVRPVRAARPHVVVGEAIGREGRKLYSRTAVFDENGILCARSRQVWIQIAASS